MEVVVVMTFVLMIVENIVVSSTQRPAGGSTGTEEGRIQSRILRQATAEFQLAALARSYHCVPERCCQGNKKSFMYNLLAEMHLTATFLNFYYKCM